MAKAITKISDLRPDEKNANKGSERGMGMLERSLRELGAGRSVLADRNGKIIAGNKTFEKAGEIGLEDVEVVHSDGTKLVVVQRDDLDLDSTEDNRARRLAIADNRTGELNLEWDPTPLVAMLEEDSAALDGLFNEQEIEVIRMAAGGDDDYNPSGGKDEARAFLLSIRCAEREPFEECVAAVRQLVTEKGWPVELK